MNWVIIGPGNGLSPVRRQAITLTNADVLSMTAIATNFSEIFIITPHLPVSSSVLGCEED